MKQMSLEKAYEITDAKIQFVSLVDKAANKKKFLITKQADGKAEFSTYGKIVKADAKNHYVTGIVYEPMVEDVHGNYMTEDEIEKACYWFTKNGNQVDLQHSFEPLPDAKVVENWVEKSDTDINGEPIKKGTWLMTVEVADDDVWQGIQKGEITGFSMGGLGNYSEEDTDLSNITKASESSENKGLLKQLAQALGFDVVEKGQVKDAFDANVKATEFWQAFQALESVLKHYDPLTGREVFEEDEDKIREALEDFNEIITELLTAGEPIGKALSSTRPIRKVGKELSGKNQKELQGIYDSLGAFLEAFNEQPKSRRKEPVGGDEEDEDDKDEKEKENEGKANDESGANENAKGNGEAEENGEASEDDNPDSEEMKAKKRPEQVESRGTSGGEGTDTDNKPKVNEDESESGEEEDDDKEADAKEDDDDLDDDKKSIKKGDTEMTRTECEDLVADTIKKAVAEITGQEIEKSADDDDEVTAEEIQQMVDEAVQKAAQPKKDEYVTPDQVQEMVTKAVGEQLEPLLKSRGLPTSLNDTVEKTVGQESQHYLHGIL